MGAVILVQLYWLSFSLIGFAAWTIYKSLSSGGRFDDYIGSRPLLTKIFFANALALCLIGLPMSVTYVFGWPTFVLEILYLILLAVGLIFGALSMPSTIAWLKRVRFTRLEALIAFLAAVTLVSSYLVSLSSGGPLQFDSQVHIAKASSVAAGHISFRDPYFGYNGVYDMRYSLNLVTTLDGMGARLLHLSPLRMWLHSYAPVIILNLLGVFSLCWEFYKGPARRVVCYSTLIISPFIVRWLFAEAQMASRESLVWIIILMIGLKVLFEIGSSRLLILGALLVAMTQPLNSAMALGFICLLAAVMLADKSLARQRAWRLGLACLVLATPIIAQLHYPDRMRTDPDAFNAIDGTVGTIYPHHYGPFTISDIHIGFSFGQLAAYAAMLWVGLTRKASKDWRPSFVLAVVGVGLEMWVFNRLLLVIIGIIYMIINASSRSTKILIGLSAVFYSLIAYNPLIFWLNGDRLPMWFIARFQNFNVLMFVAAVVGLFVLHGLPVLRWRLRIKQMYGYALLSVILIVATISIFGNLSLPFKTENQSTYISTLDNLDRLKPYLDNKLVMSDDGDLALRVPDATTASVLSFAHAQNASPMSNLPLRQACNAKLVADLALQDLKAAGVNEILTKGHNEAFLAKLDTNPFVKFQAQAGDIRSYAVSLPGNNTPARSICSIPYGQ
ncbi:MAG TPA: hypothetical protein VG964_02925 [Candidatus Saccharimonadales bacterium]|nr:hypothetical protein [Candidatus Saccharimonadales bacterium]